MEQKEELVVLVDEQDKEVGTMEKLEAHREGRLHRAISVFVFNNKRELLLQRRASGKYHSPGLWTNTCCTHPRPGESPRDAAQRRLEEEMQLTCKLHRKFSFIYKAALDNGLTEHEFDYVFVGHTDAKPKPDADEVGEWRYMNVDELDKALKANPAQFTEWFKICYDQYFFELFQ